MYRIVDRFQRGPAVGRNAGGDVKPSMSDLECYTNDIAENTQNATALNLEFCESTLPGAIRCPITRLMPKEGALQ
jgi:hypothetical protein